jgi:hypothetical protein
LTAHVHRTWIFTFTAAAYNLTRIRNLMAVTLAALSSAP